MSQQKPPDIRHGFRGIFHFVNFSHNSLTVNNFYRYPRVREGSFASVDELVRSMLDFLRERNHNPVRYQWKADGAKIKRAGRSLETAG